MTPAPASRLPAPYRDRSFPPRQAGIAALAARGELTSSRILPARYLKTCRSLVDTDEVAGRCEPKHGRIAATWTVISQSGESDASRKEAQAKKHGLACRLRRDIVSQAEPYAFSGNSPARPRAAALCLKKDRS